MRGMAARSWAFGDSGDVAIQPVSCAPLHSQMGCSTRERGRPLGSVVAATHQTMRCAISTNAGATDSSAAMRTDPLSAVPMWSMAHVTPVASAAGTTGVPSPSMGDVGTGDEVVQRALRLSARSGRVEVIAEDRPDVHVERGGRTVEWTVEPGDGPGGRITVTSTSDTIRARVPTGTDVVVGTTSGRVKVVGRVGSAAITTMSGRVSVEAAERVEVRTISGRVEVDECTEARVDAVSGRVTIGRTGAVWVSTKTGRVTVAEATGSVRARSVMGRISIRIAAAPVDARVETVSGRIEVGVPPGSRPLQRFAVRAGSIRSSVPDGGEGEIAARTVSGAIRVQEA